MSLGEATTESLQRGPDGLGGQHNVTRFLVGLLLRVTRLAGLIGIDQVTQHGHPVKLVIAQPSSPH